MAPECKFNIAVQTLYAQQLTPKGLRVEHSGGQE